MSEIDEDRWRYANHDGARLAMLERNLGLSVRERLEEMQALILLEERLAQVRTSQPTGTGNT